MLCAAYPPTKYAEVMCALSVALRVFFFLRGDGQGFRVRKLLTIKGTCGKLIFLSGLLNGLSIAKIADGAPFVTFLSVAKPILLVMCFVGSNCLGKARVRVLLWAVELTE